MQETLFMLLRRFRTFWRWFCTFVSLIRLFWTCNTLIVWWFELLTLLISFKKFVDLVDFGYDGIDVHWRIWWKTLVVAKWVQQWNELSTLSCILPANFRDAFTWFLCYHKIYCNSTFLLVILYVRHCLSDKADLHWWVMLFSNDIRKDWAGDIPSPGCGSTLTLYKGL